MKKLIASVAMLAMAGTLVAGDFIYEWEGTWTAHSPISHYGGQLIMNGYDAQGEPYTGGTYNSPWATMEIWLDANNKVAGCGDFTTHFEDGEFAFWITWGECGRFTTPSGYEVVQFAGEMTHRITGTVAFRDCWFFGTITGRLVVNPQGEPHGFGFVYDGELRSQYELRYVPE